MRPGVVVIAAVLTQMTDVGSTVRMMRLDPFSFGIDVPKLQQRVYAINRGHILLR